MHGVSQHRSTLPRWIELTVSVFDRVFYRVSARGQSQVPTTGGAILLANHLSTVDSVILRRACPRPVRFLTDNLNLETHLQAALGAGELVALFPEGEISRVGQLRGFLPETIALVARSGVPVIPVGHDGIWGSIFSYSWRKYGWKRPQFRRLVVSVCFGAPLRPDQLSPVAARSAVLDLIAEAFADRPILRSHLGREVVASLAGWPGRLAVVDRTAERRTLSAGRVFAAAAALSKWLKQAVASQRIGIVLPTGAGALIANIAVVWAGKIPVNLNFTAGASTLRSSFELAGIDTVITAGPMRAKLPDFPWPEKVIDVRSAIDGLGRVRILGWLIGAWVLPSGVLSKLLNIPKHGDRGEAALLFTSGSAGAPKGVALSHRNLLTNCCQLTSTNVLPEKVALLGCLPVFHSFGFTITIWYALLRRMKLVTIPSPLDTKRMVESIREESITVVVGAPTFLRPLLKKAQPSDLQTIELLVSGAEKMPLELHRSFLETLHVELMQGYGLTETTPVTNINQADAAPAFPGGEPQAGNRLGSVGRLLPGMTARILDPDTNAELPLTSTGMLLFRGENVFSGYLRDPEKTRLALKDGWFVTGDLARFDDDGFLFIEGRLSRFSKIGGEMVPHGTVEQKLIEVLGFEQRETPVIVIVGIPDPSKGEALVLITTEDIASETIRERLSAAGFANLWIPRVIIRVEKIPLLGTGKIDLQACRKIAAE